jgi:Skp family chaperone for outer membrane proteins
MIAAGVMAVAMATASAQAAGIKVAVVDYLALVQASPQYRSAIATLRTQFLPEQKHLQAEATALKTKQATLQRNAATMTQDQIEQAELNLREKAQAFQQEQVSVERALNTRRNELMSKVQKTLVSVVQTYAQRHGYNLVLSSGAVLYADGTIDITPALLKELKGPAAH